MVDKRRFTYSLRTIRSTILRGSGLSTKRSTRLAPMNPAEPVMRMVLWLRGDIGNREFRVEGLESVMSFELKVDGSGRRMVTLIGWSG